MLFALTPLLPRANFVLTCFSFEVAIKEQFVTASPSRRNDSAISVIRIPIPPLPGCSLLPLIGCKRSLDQDTGSYPRCSWHRRNLPQLSSLVNNGTYPLFHPINFIIATSTMIPADVLLT